MATETILSRLLSQRATALGLTPSDVAERMSERGGRTHRQSASAWLSGEYAPGNDRLPALAAVLGLSLTDLALAAAGVEPPGAPATTASPGAAE